MTFIPKREGPDLKVGDVVKSGVCAVNNPILGCVTELRMMSDQWSFYYEYKVTFPDESFTWRSVGELKLASPLEILAGQAE